jgi:hypothetical protein
MNNQVSDGALGGPFVKKNIEYEGHDFHLSFSWVSDC